MQDLPALGRIGRADAFDIAWYTRALRSGEENSSAAICNPKSTEPGQKAPLTLQVRFTSPAGGADAAVVNRLACAEGYCVERLAGHRSLAVWGLENMRIADRPTRA